MRKLWRDHSLLIILIVLLAVFMTAGFFLGIPEWTSESKHMGESTALWPGYWLHWGYDTVESMLADIFGPLLLITLGIKWWDRKSKESGTP